MKNQMMSILQQVGQDVKEMEADSSLFVQKVSQDPEIKYREDFFQALKVLGLNDQEAAALAMEVVLDVTHYDSEVSQSFCSQILIPMINLSLKNKDILPVHKYLNEKDFLKSVVKASSLQYKM